MSPKPDGFRLLRPPAAALLLAAVSVAAQELVQSAAPAPDPLPTNPASAAPEVPRPPARPAAGPAGPA
ncbi:MAG TPA: hypothetical protein VEB66_02820, partial [Opitutaceae bacterium]|nr:hypothetical protein [Opitutaceae bacterium]